jgi:hypothetical protein
MHEQDRSPVARAFVDVVDADAIYLQILRFEREVGKVFEPLFGCT